MSKAAQLLAMLQAEEKPEATFGEGAAQGMSEGLLGNLMGVPELPLRGVRYLSNGIRSATGNEPIPYPQEGLLGLPTGREAAAGIDTGLGLLGLDSGGYEENMARRNMVEQTAPAGFATGGVGADIATIAAGRAPLVKGPGGVFDGAIKSSIDDAVKGLGNSKTGVKKFTKDIVNSELFRDVARGLGRSTETGIEGLALAAIQGGNPQQAAAVSAGTQMGASLVNTGVAELFEFIPESTGGVVKPPKTLKGKIGVLGAYGALMGNVLFLAQNILPGGDNEGSSEASFDKVAGMLVLGATLGLAGRRSVPDGALSAFPKFADFVNQVPRTVMTSMISDMTKDDLSKRVIDRIQQAPDAFSEAQMDSLLAGIEQGRFAETVSKLAEDEEFRNILDAPDPRLAKVPKDGD